MSGGGDGDEVGGFPPKLSLRQRLLLALPRLSRGEDRAPLGERLRQAVLKPVEPGAASRSKAPDGPQSVEELEQAVRYADDKERLVGLLLAPVAGALAIIVVSAQIANNPAALLKNGHINRHYVNPSLLHELELVLLALAVAMLATAYFRKRTFLGIVMALYGLAVFNLHWWGFGIPYIMGGAWLLVRAYRLQRDLREATGETPGRPGSGGRRGRAGRTTDTGRPQPNKRYTPPTSSPKRTPPSKPEDEKRAG